MSNLLERAIDCDDGDRAAKMIQDALGIESDDVANYVFPRTWPADREQRARIIGEWLQTEARFLASAVPPTLPRLLLLSVGRLPGTLGYFSWVEIELNVLLSFVPVPFTTAMMATESRRRSGHIR